MGDRPDSRGPSVLTRVVPGEPHAIRGPFARWPRSADAVVAAFAFLGTLLTIAVSNLTDGADLAPGALLEPPAGAIALVAIGAGAVWWRRSYPVEVAAVVLAVMLAWAVAHYGDGNDLALVIAAYSVGRYASNVARGAFVTAVALAISIIGSLIDPNQLVDVWPALLTTALPWYVGMRVRNRGDYLALLRERNERLEAEQHAQAQQAVAAERTRIARELHDVVAHQVSMMTVQAGAAKTIARVDADAAIEAMGDVERAGRQALGELRHLLGVLRPDPADGGLLTPQPGLANLPILIDELVHIGATVDVSTDALPTNISTTLDLSAYRIVQEAVTNIVKHAGPEPVVEIAIGVADRSLTIDITNTTGDTTGLPSSGYGILGMTERATLLGGTLTVGPEGNDRFGVHARLPLESEPT